MKKNCIEADLWRHCYFVKEAASGIFFSNHDNIIIGLIVNLCSSTISFINVYLSCCYKSNANKCLKYFGKLGELREDIQHPPMCIIVDFSASYNIIFDPFLNSFYQYFSFTIFDETILPKSFLRACILVMLVTIAAELIFVCPPVQPTPQ